MPRGAMPFGFDVHVIHITHPVDLRAGSLHGADEGRHHAHTKVARRNCFVKTKGCPSPIRANLVAPSWSNARSPRQTNPPPVKILLTFAPLPFSPTAKLFLVFSCALIGRSILHGAQDSAPVLVSRSGGGGESWSDLKELQQAAAKGNPKAEAQLGELLLRGEGLPVDGTRGVALLEKAARAGQSAAAFRVGMLLANGESGVAKDPARALDYFRAAAAGGEAEAFYNLGVAHSTGRGVKRSYGEALGWFILARERGAGGDTESRLRAQIKSQPAWIATGERRSKEIIAEFKDKKVADLLPPAAPLYRAFDPLKPVR